MAHGLLARIPWGMKAWPLYGYEAQSRVAFLARFSSTMWLAERNINIMSVCCNAAGMVEPGSIQGYMAPVYLGAQLQGIGDWDAERIQGNRDLSHWKNTAIEKQYHYIHIPVNFLNAHWVVFLIDIKAKTYSFGMSLVPVCMDVPC